VGALSPVAHWPAAGRRPQGYPAGLPFVPGRPVRIDEREDSVVMNWHGVAQPADLVQQLVGASVADGWRQAAGAPPSPGAAQTLRFVRDDADRILEAVHAGPFAFVTLTQSTSPERGRRT
jgi:hypothetical protein